MERREFLKAVGLAAAVPVIPAASKTLTLKKPERVEMLTTSGVPIGSPASRAAFNPKHRYGMSLAFTERSEAGVAKAKDMLLSHARQTLPRGTKFYLLDGGEWNTVETGRADLIAWYYSPTGLQEPQMKRVIAEVTA